MSFYAHYSGSIKTKPLTKEEQTNLIEALASFSSEKVSFDTADKRLAKKIGGLFFLWKCISAKKYDVEAGEKSYFIFDFDDYDKYFGASAKATFDKIAPYTEEGEFLYVGDGDEHWRFIFQDGQFMEQNGRIVYDEGADTYPTIYLPLPDGTRLRAKAVNDGKYPAISIDLLKGEETELICFAEFNPEKERGSELCIGAYQSNEEDTVYYKPYNDIQQFGSAYEGE